MVIHIHIPPHSTPDMIGEGDCVKEEGVRSRE